jgi:hypothetical protein
MKDVKARKDRGIADLQPFVVPRTGILPREDEFAEGKEAEFDRVHTIGGGTSDVPEQLIGQEGDLGPDMRQPPVRRDENGRLVAVPVSEHPQDPDVDAIFKELVAQVFGDGAVLALLTQGVVFASRRYQPAL